MNVALTACKCADFNKTFNLTIVVKEVMQLALFQKIRMYFSSLWLLFVFLTIRDIDLTHLDPDNFMLEQFLHDNLCKGFAIVWILLAFGCILDIKWLQRKWTGTLSFSKKIADVSPKNSDYVAFVSTCILPLLAFDSSKLNHLVLMIAIILALGFVFIQNDMYYANPTLAILGYRLYEASVQYRGKSKPRPDTSNSASIDSFIDSAGNMQAQRALTPTDSTHTFYKRVTIISHNRLKNGDYVKLKSLNTDCSVYFAKLKGVNNEAR